MDGLGLYRPGNARAARSESGNGSNRTGSVIPVGDVR